MNKTPTTKHCIMKKLLCLLLLCCVHAMGLNCKAQNTDSIAKETNDTSNLSAWQKFLTQNIKTEIAELNKAPKGIYQAVVGFKVDTAGNIFDIKPLTKIGFGTEEEVVRVIKLAGRYEPMVVNGKKITCNKKQRITFYVGDDIEPTEEDAKPTKRIIGIGRKLRPI